MDWTWQTSKGLAPSRFGGGLSWNAAADSLQWLKQLFSPRTGRLWAGCIGKALFRVPLSPLVYTSSTADAAALAKTSLRQLLGKVKPLIMGKVLGDGAGSSYRGHEGGFCYQPEGLSELGNAGHPSHPQCHPCTDLGLFLKTFSGGNFWY